MNYPDSYPIHAFTKNEEEEVLFHLKKYNGRYCMDLRIWFKEEAGGPLIATKKGVFLPIEKLGEMRKCLDLLTRLIEAGNMPQLKDLADLRPQQPKPAKGKERKGSSLRPAT